LTEAFAAKQGEDPGLPLAVAKPFLDLTGHITCTWMLLKSAVLADSMLGSAEGSAADQAFYRGKIFTAQFAAADLLAQVGGLAEGIYAWDRSILDMAQDSF
jgi:hypothetical protein